MRITKIFTAEGSHVVRNCTSKRCSHSVHGHSYKIEVEFEATRLDNAQMVMDFGLMKGSIKELIDSMDHCHIITDTEPEEYINFFKENNDRYIITPFNPSAEMLSVFIFRLVKDLLQDSVFANGESGVEVRSVTVWETATGRAKATYEDLNFLPEDFDKRLKFSEGVTSEWSDALVGWWFLGNKIFYPAVTQQIELK